jgi:hypothetical protein
MVVEGHETFYAVEFRTKESEAGGIGRYRVTQSHATAVL